MFFVSHVFARTYTSRDFRDNVVKQTIQIRLLSSGRICCRTTGDGLLGNGRAGSRGLPYASLEKYYSNIQIYCTHVYLFDLNRFSVADCDGVL